MMKKINEKIIEIEDRLQITKIKKMFANEAFVKKLSTIFMFLGITFIVLSSLFANYGITVAQQIFSYIGQAFIVCFALVFGIKLFAFNKEGKKNEVSDKK